MGTLFATVILPALVPALADGLRGIFARVTQGKGAMPQSVDDVIRLMEAQTARLEALAKLDTMSPNVSRWVADLRGAFRYIAVGGVVLATVGLVAADAMGAEVADAGLSMMLELTGACMSFIIGERMYLAVKR